MFGLIVWLRALQPLFCLLTLTGIILGQEHGPGVKVVVKEGSDVVLPCSLSTKENIESKLFDWKKVSQKDEGLKEVFLYDSGSHYNNGQDGQSEEFKGRVSHFQDELKHGNASIIIRNTKISDSGNYTCYFPHLRPPQKFYIELLVAASPEPVIRTLKATSGWALLQCEVHRASLTSGAEWQDSAGNTLPAEETRTPDRDHHYITLNTTVTKTDNYRCVVTQEEISHQTHAEIFVHISEKECVDSSNKVDGWIGGLHLGALIVVAVQALLVVTKVITIRCNKGPCQQRDSLVIQAKYENPEKRESLVILEDGPCPYQRRCCLHKPALEQQLGQNQ